MRKFNQSEKTYLAVEGENVFLADEFVVIRVNDPENKLIDLILGHEAIFDCESQPLKKVDPVFLLLVDQVEKT